LENVKVVLRVTEELLTNNVAAGKGPKLEMPLRNAKRLGWKTRKCEGGKPCRCTGGKIEQIKELWILKVIHSQKSHRDYANQTGREGVKRG